MLAGSRSAVLAEEAQHPFVARRPVARDEAGVQQRHPVRAEVRGEGVVGGLRVLHGVADDDGAPALGERLVEHGHEVLRGLRDQREDRSARLGAPASDHVDIHFLPAP